MRLILFTLYYVKLIIGVWLGIRQTDHPLDIRFRWRYWQKRNQRRPFLF